MIDYNDVTTKELYNLYKNKIKIPFPFEGGKKWLYDFITKNNKEDADGCITVNRRRRPPVQRDTGC